MVHPAGVATITSLKPLYSSNIARVKVKPGEVENYLIIAEKY